MIKFTPVHYFHNSFNELNKTNFLYEKIESQSLSTMIAVEMMIASIMYYENNQCFAFIGDIEECKNFGHNVMSEIWELSDKNRPIEREIKRNARNVPYCYYKNNVIEFSSVSKIDRLLDGRQKNFIVNIPDELKFFDDLKIKISDYQSKFENYNNIWLIKNITKL